MSVRKMGCNHNRLAGGLAAGLLLAASASPALAQGAAAKVRIGGEAQVGGVAEDPGAVAADDGAAAEAGEADSGDGQPRAASVPELHPVVKGDSLWALCRHYFGDPWKWPQLWSLNPLVTNPHWIFPGDVVRLKMTDGEGAPSDGLEAPSLAQGPKLFSSRQGAGGSEAVMLRDLGFVESADLRAAGKITGSREEKILLSTGDQAYVGFRKDKPMRAGERYSIFEVDTTKPIIDPKTQKQLGYLVRIHGDIVIDQIAENSSGRGTLVDMVEPVERGFFVSNQIKQFKRVQSRPSQVTVESRVIASFTPVNLLSAMNFVVLSRGSKDGLEIGNRTYVIRRGDGYARLLEGWEQFDAAYPKEVVAELLVVDVKENTSVAWISRSTKELRVGETTETRKGY